VADWTPEKIEPIMPQGWDVVSHVPTLADAWDVNGPAIAQNMRDTMTAVRDPQTWTDAAREYGLAGLMAGGGAAAMAQPAEAGRSMADVYNTPLTPEEESQYQAWGAQQAPLRDGRNPAQDVYDYDMRGFWKNGASFADNGHGADQFKKPNHPTFSDQSQYHSADGNQGGTWTTLPDGKYAFTPSQFNLQNWPADELQSYWSKVEAPAGNVLNLPGAPAAVAHPTPGPSNEWQPVSREPIAAEPISATVH